MAIFGGKLVYTDIITIAFFRRHALPLSDFMLKYMCKNSSATFGKGRCRITVLMLMESASNFEGRQRQIK